MMHGVVIAYGGIPMIYYGDELGTLNDYSFVKDRSRQDDNRWVHRPVFDWEKAERRHKKNTVEHYIFTGIANMLSVRRDYPVMGDHNNVLLPETNNEHVLVFARVSENMSPILVVANLTNEEQFLEASILFRVGLDSHGLIDLISGKKIMLGERGIHITGCHIYWLTDKKV